jgi:hypothetical protein
MGKPGRAFVYSRFGQRYPNILGFKQYLLVFGLKQYNLLWKEFSLQLPISMVSLLGEDYFVNNWFMEEKTIYLRARRGTRRPCCCKAHLLT